MKYLLNGAMSAIAIFAATCAHAGAGSRYDNESPVPVATMGARVGMQMQNLYGSTPWNNKFSSGVLGGAFFGVYHKYIGGRVEATVRSVEYKNVNTGARVKIGNFDIPLLAEVRPMRELKVHVGTQLTVFPLVEDRGGNDAKRFFASQEFSFVIGVEGDLPWKIIAGARFIKGLSDINDSYMVGKWTTASGQFYVGYRFFD
jgi:hypothetical protein